MLEKANAHQSPAAPRDGCCSRWPCRPCLRSESREIQVGGKISLSLRQTMRFFSRSECQSRGVFALLRSVAAKTKEEMGKLSRALMRAGFLRRRRDLFFQLRQDVKSGGCRGQVLLATQPHVKGPGVAAAAAVWSGMVSSTPELNPALRPSALSSPKRGCWENPWYLWKIPLDADLPRSTEGPRGFKREVPRT